MYLSRLQNVFAKLLNVFGFVFLVTVFFNYMAWQVKRFLRGHCPDQKMSCIGKYQRNVINFQQTTYWMLFWQVSLLLDIPLQNFLEENQTLSKQAKFFIWNAKGVFLNECFICIQLAIKVPDTKTKLVQHGKFYVRNPTLEPRRLMWQIERGPPTVSIGVQQIVLEQIVLEKRMGSGESQSSGSQIEDQNNLGSQNTNQTYGRSTSSIILICGPDLPAMPNVDT